jgi:hypothetical protein
VNLDQPLPPVKRVLAADDYVPRVFGYRGSRRVSTQSRVGRIDEFVDFDSRIARSGTLAGHGQQWQGRGLSATPGEHKDLAPVTLRSVFKANI